MWRALVLLGAASIATAAEHPGPPPVAIPVLMGRPDARPAELLGTADGATVWIEKQAYTLPSANGATAVVETCRVVVADVKGEHDRTLEAVRIIDGVPRLRWRGAENDAPGVWRARLRTATHEGATCAEAAATLRKDVVYREPRIAHATSDDLVYELGREHPVDHVTFRVGPDAAHLLAVGLHNGVPVMYSIVDKKTP